MACKGSGSIIDLRPGDPTRAWFKPGAAAGLPDHAAWLGSQSQEQAALTRSWDRSATSRRPSPRPPTIEGRLPAAPPDSRTQAATEPGRFTRLRGWGEVVHCEREPPAHQWHARSQGFNPLRCHRLSRSHWPRIRLRAGVRLGCARRWSGASTLAPVRVGWSRKPLRPASPIVEADRVECCLVHSRARQSAPRRSARERRVQVTRTGYTRAWVRCLSLS
jgi:hypothetical protein